jgi:hypothetical protein
VIGALVLIAVAVSTVMLLAYFVVGSAMNAIHPPLLRLPDSVVANCCSEGCTAKATRARRDIVVQLESRGRYYFDPARAPQVYCDEHRPLLAQLHPIVRFAVTIITGLALFAVAINALTR